MNELLTLPDEITEYDNPDAFLQECADTYEHQPSAPEGYFPSEYVVFYTGPRGSSKTLQLARHSLLGLAQGLKVFTNLELYPEKAGITTQPLPVDLSFLLSFDESLTDAVIAISEIDTWFDRMRETSTGNRLGGKFLQQLRKKGLRVFFDTQDYLPGGLMRQVDKLVFCHDFFWTDWGREHQIRKGTTFYYDCMDYSGIFTGRRGRTWQEVLHHAEKIWPLFNTNKIHDPLQFARKLKVVGGEMEYNQDTHEMYDPAEREQRDWEREVEGHKIEAKHVLETYEASGFLTVAKEYQAVRRIKHLLRFSLRKLGQMIAALPQQERVIAEDIRDELVTLAQAQRIARFHPNANYIEFYAPETSEGGTDAEG